MVGAARLDLLCRCSLLSDLSPPELELVGTLVRWRSYRRGEVVFHRGDPGDVIHLVCRGRLKVVLTSASGEEAVLAIVGPGEHFGELALLDRQPRSATVVALEPVETATLGRGDFLSLMRRSPTAAKGMLLALVRTVRRSTDEVSDLMFIDLHGRLAKKLLELAELHGRQGAGAIAIEVPITQEDLAGMIGATRASVNKVLGVFEGRGLLVRRGRQIIVQNVPGLHMYVDEADRSDVG